MSGPLRRPSRGRSAAREAAELARLVSPFTLPCMKRTVLAELPDKIEDLRTCRLSDEHVRFYRDAVSRRTPALPEALGALDQPEPYVHVFALLSLLKQICDHPAPLQPSVSWTAGKRSWSSPTSSG
ncbi:MAG: DEAD/DEAH box helicase [Deltaproteobacteria bacterium]|nr:DEAD/DEAH box helicase [Deltaproteobacteria bacterium]